MDIYTVLDGVFERGYMREVAKQIKIRLPGQEKILCERIVSNAHSLVETNRILAVDKPALSNIKITSLALATYRTLMSIEIEKREALNMVKTILVEPQRRKIAFSMRLMLRLNRNPMSMMVGISRRKQKSAYGIAFEFEEETDASSSFFTSKVKKCLYHDFFCANGTPELTLVFCAYDDTWGEILAGGEFGVQFSRPTTLASGDDMCRFQFRRTTR